MAYGLLSLVLGFIILALTAWVVDRLERREPTARRVAWRPWYRTAIVCAYYLAMGASVASGHPIIGPLLFEFVALAGLVVLFILQWSTRSSIPLQAMEIFGLCLSFMLGTVIVYSFDANGTGYRAMVARLRTEFGPDRSLQDMIFVFVIWFSTLTSVAAAGTVVTRIVLRAFGFSTNPAVAESEDA